uniref:Uncharacterized protein n=1 Tax=Sphaerodactylus townsendi TaxID=933632 RepID=A0ACB8GAE7_9SAUR
MEEIVIFVEGVQPPWLRESYSPPLGKDSTHKLPSKCTSLSFCSNVMKDSSRHHADRYSPSPNYNSPNHISADPRGSSDEDLYRASNLSHKDEFGQTLDISLSKDLTMYSKQIVHMVNALNLILVTPLDGLADLEVGWVYSSSRYLATLPISRGFLDTANNKWAKPSMTWRSTKKIEKLRFKNPL